MGTSERCLKSCPICKIEFYRIEGVPLLICSCLNQEEIFVTGYNSTNGESHGPVQASADR